MWFSRSLMLVGLSLASVLALADTLIVEEAQVRAVPPVSTTTAAFMLLRNPGEQDLAVLDAFSPAAENTELHNHVEEDGVMQMRRVQAINVPAGGSVELAPGGLHLMLIDLVETLEEGDQVELTLELDNAERVSFEAPVKLIEVMDEGVDHGHHAH